MALKDWKKTRNGFEHKSKRKWIGFTKLKDKYDMHVYGKDIITHTKYLKNKKAALTYAKSYMRKH